MLLRELVCKLTAGAFCGDMENLRVHNISGGTIQALPSLID